MAGPYEEKYNVFQCEERYNKTSTEIEFNAPCPVDGCSNKDRIIRWCHKNCGGKTWLTDKGELRCVKCGRIHLFIDWKFDCGAHDAQYARQINVP